MTPCAQAATLCAEPPTPCAQPATPCPSAQPAAPRTQAAWLTRQQLVSQGLASTEGREFQGGEGGGTSVSEGVRKKNNNSEAIAAQRQWLRAQELLAATPFSLGEELRAPTPLMPSPMAALGDTAPVSAGLPPSLFSPRRLSASEILPPPCLPDEGEEGVPFGLDLRALGGADPLPLPVVLSRPTPPRQHRRRGHKQAGPPLHLRTAPPAATTCTAAAATCAVGAGNRGGAPRGAGGAPGGWRDAGNQSGSALDCAFAPLRALSQTPDPPARQRGLANSESWSPPPTM